MPVDRRTQRQRGAVAMEPRDVRRVRGGVPLSDRELELLHKERGEMPMAPYFREAVLEAVAADLGVSLDEMDTVRRGSPRRTNYAERAKGKQQRGGAQ